MERRHEIIILAIIILVIILGLAIVLMRPILAPGGPKSPVNTTGAGIPNPAATYCKNMNNTYEIRTAPDGSQYGVCILPGGTVCDEWEYFRGNCTVPAATGGAITDPAKNFCLSRYYIYQTRTDVNGTEETFCIFPNGKECDAWDYYLGKCDETTGQTA